MSFKLRVSLLLLTVFCISDCTIQSTATTTSAEEKKLAAKTASLNKTTQKSVSTNYICKDNKAVKVVPVVKKNKKSKNIKMINLTFNNLTRRLTPIVSENGQKYSSIHWEWSEKEEFSTLTDSTGKVLAEHCVKQ